MNEAYHAMANGIHPTVVFRHYHSADYHGEKICLFHDKQYRVVRTYQTGFGIELTCEEITIDRAIMEGNDA